MKITVPHEAVFTGCSLSTRHFTQDQAMGKSMSCFTVHLACSFLSSYRFVRYKVKPAFGFVWKMHKITTKSIISWFEKSCRNIQRKVNLKTIWLLADAFANTLQATPGSILVSISKHCNKHSELNLQKRRFLVFRFFFKIDMSLNLQ